MSNLVGNHIVGFPTKRLKCVFHYRREPLSRGDTGIDDKHPEGREQEAEPIKIVGEVDVDDKSARPRSEQVELYHVHTVCWFYNN